jgi:hypothetical protein
MAVRAQDADSHRRKLILQMREQIVTGRETTNEEDRLRAYQLGMPMR